MMKTSREAQARRDRELEHAARNRYSCGTCGVRGVPLAFIAERFVGQTCSATLPILPSLASAPEARLNGKVSL